jgi:hypothetical protein
MKTYYAVGLGMLAGFGLGAIAIQGIHAQAKPPVYLITEIDVKDAAKYGSEFAPKAQATVRSAGAKFVLIGGWRPRPNSPSHLLLFYQAALKIGKQYADFRRYAVEGQ